MLEAEFQIVSDNLFIVNFIGRRPKLGLLEPGMDLLNYEIKQGKVTFNHEVGHGFFYLECDKCETTKQMFMQSRFHSGFGTCVFRPWVPAFDADNPFGLQMPTWITIK